MSQHKQEKMLDSLKGTQAEIDFLMHFRALANNKDKDTNIDQAVLKTEQLTGKNKAAIDFTTFQAHAEKFLEHWKNARSELERLDADEFRGLEATPKERAEAQDKLNASEPTIDGIKIRLARLAGTAESYGLSTSPILGNITLPQLKDQIIFDALMAEANFDLIFNKNGHQRDALVAKNADTSFDEPGENPVKKLEEELRGASKEAWLRVKQKFKGTSLFVLSDSGVPQINSELDKLIESEIEKLNSLKTAHLVQRQTILPEVAQTVVDYGIKLQISVDKEGQVSVLGKAKNKREADKAAQEIDAMLPAGINCTVQKIKGRFIDSYKIHIEGMDETLAKQLAHLTQNKASSPRSRSNSLDLNMSGSRGRSLSNTSEPTQKRVPASFPPSPTSASTILTSLSSSARSGFSRTPSPPPSPSSTNSQSSSIVHPISTSSEPTQKRVPASFPPSPTSAGSVLTSLSSSARSGFSRTPSPPPSPSTTNSQSSSIVHQFKDEQQRRNQRTQVAVFAGGTQSSQDVRTFATKAQPSFFKENRPFEERSAQLLQRKFDMTTDAGRKGYLEALNRIEARQAAIRKITQVERSDHRQEIGPGLALTK